MTESFFVQTLMVRCTMMTKQYSMIRAAGAGYAVFNAVDEVKLAAEHVTVSNNEHAIAKIIDDIDSGKVLI